MADIAVDKAELIGLFVETLLYGIFVSLFHQSLRILLNKKSINWPLILTSVAIFLTATGHLTVLLCRTIGAFVDHRNAKGGPVAYYGNLRTALEVCQASFQVAVGLLGDFMAVYRVFVVYKRNYLVIIVPTLCLCGTIVSSVGSVVTIGQLSTTESPFFFPKLEIWMPTFFSLTFCTSIICSGLIAARLWYITDEIMVFSETKGTPKMRAVQRILIESAVMYAASMLVYLITYMAKTNYNIIFGDMVSPIIGIAFSLITIRVNDTFYPSQSSIAIAPQSAPITFAFPQSQRSTPLASTQTGTDNASPTDIHMKHMPYSVEGHPTVRFADHDQNIVASGKESV